MPVDYRRASRGVTVSERLEDPRRVGEADTVSRDGGRAARAVAVGVRRLAG